MKHLVTIISIVFIGIALYSLFKAQESAIEHQREARQKGGGCVNLDKFIADNPDYTEEEYIRLEKCNKERAARLGLDKPGTGFLGNTKAHPAGALAHYESGRGTNIFTVYDDYIEIKLSSGLRPQDTEIPYSSIEDVGIALETPNTIYIVYRTNNYPTMRYTLTLVGILRMKKSVGVRDVDRLVELIKKQREIHLAEVQIEDELDEEKESEVEEKVE